MALPEQELAATLMALGMGQAPGLGGAVSGAALASQAQPLAEAMLGAQAQGVQFPTAPAFASPEPEPLGRGQSVGLALADALSAAGRAFGGQRNPNFTRLALNQRLGQAQAQADAANRQAMLDFQTQTEQARQLQARDREELRAMRERGQRREDIAREQERFEATQAVRATERAEDVAARDRELAIREGRLELDRLKAEANDPLSNAILEQNLLRLSELNSGLGAQLQDFDPGKTTKEQARKAYERQLRLSFLGDSSEEFVASALKTWDETIGAAFDDLPEVDTTRRRDGVGGIVSGVAGERAAAALDPMIAASLSGFDPAALATAATIGAAPTAAATIGRGILDFLFDRGPSGAGRSF